MKSSNFKPLNQQPQATLLAFYKKNTHMSTNF